MLFLPKTVICPHCYTVDLFISLLLIRQLIAIFHHLIGYSCGSVSQLCLTLCDPMDCSTLGFSVLHYLLEFIQVHVHSMMPSNHLILCHHLSLCPQYFFNGRQYIISFRFVFLHHTEKPVIQAVRSPFLQHWMPYSISDRLYYSIILLVRRLFKTFNGNIYSFKTLYSYKDW